MTSNIDIDEFKYPAPKQDYKVLVRCFTFNHSKYIEETLNGFAAQQTNFPFVCLVVDDSSTDGEQEVINAWISRECNMNQVEIIDISTSVVIIAPHKINFSCTFAFYFLKKNLYKSKEKKMLHVSPWRNRCEYEAICEGDDYWIDPLKLQKQVDFLETNPEYVMVYTNAFMYNQNEGKLKKMILDKTEISFENLLLRNTIPTLTVLYKFDAMKNYNLTVKPTEKTWLLGDYPMWLWLSLQGKIKFLPDYTSVYRYLEESASHSKDYVAAKRFTLSTISIKEFYMDLVKVTTKDSIDESNNHSLFDLAFYYKDMNDLVYYYNKMINKTIKDRFKFLIGCIYIKIKEL